MAQTVGTTGPPPQPPDGPPSLGNYLAPAQNLPSPIGVPEGYTVDSPVSGEVVRGITHDTGNILRPPTQGPYAPVNIPMGPRYFDGDELAPASLPVEDRAALQRAMAAAGVLTGEFQLGVWDQPTRNAYTSLLAFANQAGLTWPQALNQWASGQRVETDDDGNLVPAGQERLPTFEREPFVPDTLIQPDEAAVEQQIRESVESRIGRDLTEDELSGLVADFMNLYRQQHQAEQGLAEETHRASENRRFQQHLQAAGGGVAGLAGNVGPTTPPAEAEIPDAAARFEQIVQERYGNRIETLEDAGEREQTVANLSGLFGGVAALTGGR